jgi:dTDP-4-dehydrorhamnose 3,5-epimerase
MVALQPIVDARGDLTTVFASERPAAVPVQWNLVRSRPGVVRGVHVHRTYDEHYVPASGRIFVFLKDARRASPTFGLTLNCWLDATQPVALRVPAGVAHGLAFPTGGVILCGLSDQWTGQDELECRWDDAALRVVWPVSRPILSSRDANAGTYADMLQRLDDVVTHSPVS